MVAQVTLEIALRKEFDYLIPPDLDGRVEVGTRVKVPFGRRQVLGCVTGLAENSEHDSLKPILKVIGAQSLVTPRVLELARWMAEYYCCAPETAMKSVLPDAVRKEQEGWRERLFVRLLPVNGDATELSKRQAEVYHVIEEHRSIAMQELLRLTGTTAQTVRRLEDKGLVEVAPQISERDPYANAQIIPTQPLDLNADQAEALREILASMDRAAGILPAEPPGTPFFNKKADTKKFSGALPHWRQEDKIYFVTFRLHDSIAQDQLRAWQEEKKIWENHNPKPWTEKVRAEHIRRFTGEMEKMLDAGHGSCALGRPEVGQMVEEALRKFDGGRYQLGEYVIMPNHVHVLVRPMEGEKLSKIVHSWKSFTAKQANKLLETSGAFWKDEYFDHLVRDENRYRKYRDYIEGNPGKAGLREGWILGKGSFVVPSACRQDAGSTGGTFLLNGVTGSGKTEVYLQAIARALELGKGAIVLVPEISLTPQTVERFKARFSSGPQQTLVAVLHSHLSAGERHDEWHKIRQGRARIVIGARSAIFAPAEPLGLVIVDEEHEHSYKQEEAPRYHARDVAVVRGQREGAVVVLGSATPSLESFYNVERGKYAVLDLPLRADDKRMPVVRVQDMRTECRKDKGVPIFSTRLKEAIRDRLENGEQTILFLNRRGFATSMQCPECGFVAECPNCSLSLTYHRREQALRCHICGHGARAPGECPECRSRAIRFHGLGTEKVEDVLGKLFPDAAIRRMDSDTLKRKEDYRRILGDFRRGKIDILVGTQMIAKGLHFPRVTLVGIVYADTGLHLADFRAGERTFQLLTQVAGRAGRGDVEGEVIVQSFTPFHPAIQFARRHDFAGFYDAEMEFRGQLKYPPYTRAAMLTLRGRNEEKVAFSAEHLKKAVEPLAGGIADLVIAGPAPAPLLRAEAFYRYQIMLRTGQMSALSRGLAEVTAGLALPEEVTLTVDIDPVNLL